MLITSLPERIYKASKLWMWQKFHYSVARMGHFGSSSSRLCFMDTDSLFNSYQRERSSLEIHEINELLRTGQRIPFEASLTAQRMTNHYLQSYGEILDYSSITEVRLTLSKEIYNRCSILIKHQFIFGRNLSVTESLRTKNPTEKSSRTGSSAGLFGKNDPKSTSILKGRIGRSNYQTNRNVIA